MNIANTILAQLGGHRFTTMTGAKNLSASNISLSFHLTQRMCKNKAKFCTITLDDTDTYTVKFQRLQGGKFGSLVTISTHKMVHADRLQDLFVEQTGLAV